METIECLNWRRNIEENRKDARRSGNDFYIYDIFYRPPMDYPFKIGEYGCCICLEGEAEGCIDLMPCRLKPSMMAINVPGQLLEQHAMSSGFYGIGITMSQGFIKGLGFPYNFQLDRMLRDSPMLELSPLAA